MRTLLLVLLLFAPALQAEPLANRLRHHPSPYLALHGTDPTAWQEWNAETVARARRENKLLFVSLGYFSCHWCHVMQKESYRDPEIAAFLNAHFIPVKVDRELDPALDAQLQAFAEATRGQSGWPLNVFITPEGYPLFALLYAPPAEFLQAVQRLAARWDEEGPQLARLAREAALPPPPPLTVEARFAPAIGVLYQQRLVEEALAHADVLQGGFGKVSKFPHAPQLAALLAIEGRKPNPRLAEFLRLSLDQMARLGLRDHVAGGFFRYTVDPDWHTPHFEKMLYDNAQLAAVYLDASRLLARPEYRDIAYETLDFMLENLRDVSGGFVTSTSAVDEAGREGGVYLWDKAELARLLDAADYSLVERIWGLGEPPSFELGYLPMARIVPTAAETARLRAIHARLKAERARRGLLRDEKLLAGLNGLALAALARAAQDEPRYRPAARAVRDFLVQRLMTDQGLRKGIASGQVLGPADLEDYAYVAEGLLAYALLDESLGDRERARTLVTRAWDLFHGPHGWTLDTQPLLARPYYQRIVPDGATPAPAAVLIRTSWRLGGKPLRTRALRALNVGYEILDQGVFWYATQVAAMGEIQ
ncbi:thioredoxin domain-containing protein [Thiobacter aerophilum]|uniref:DUF255 domain-containing protein n=1 Tax=Thiobacter aerophilum TaxID=3121275 RepID=A0ABV0EGX9_9BURK